MNNKISAQEIIGIVSFVTDVPIISIKAKNRKFELVRARNLIYYFVDKHTNKMDYEIGNLVNVDRVTTRNGLKRLEQDIKQNYKNTANYFNDCKKLINELINKEPLYEYYFKQSKI